METTVSISEGSVSLGASYIFSEYYPDSNGVNLLLRIGEHNTHFYCCIESENDGRIELYEDAVVSSTGIEKQSFNTNRSSDRPTNNHIFQNPVFSGGAKIINGILGKAKESCSKELPPLIVLKPNTDYVVRVILQDQTNVSIFITLTV